MNSIIKYANWILCKTQCPLFSLLPFDNFQKYLHLELLFGWKVAKIQGLLKMFSSNIYNIRPDYEKTQEKIKERRN